MLQWVGDDRRVIVSVVVILYGDENEMGGRAKPGLCDEPLYVELYPNHIEE